MDSEQRFLSYAGVPLIPSRFCPKICPHCGLNPYVGAIGSREELALMSPQELATFDLTGRCISCQKVPHEEPKDSS